MKRYFIFTVREFLGLDNDYESLLQNQEEILKKLNTLELLETENQGEIFENKQESYFNFQNLFWLIIFLAFIGGGFWLYNADFFNNTTLESIKSLGTLSKDLHAIDQGGILDALKKLNENSVNLSKEEIKLLLEIKNLLLKKGIDENTSTALDTPVGTLAGTIEWGDFRD